MVNNFLGWTLDDSWCLWGPWFVVPWFSLTVEDLRCLVKYCWQQVTCNRLDTRKDLVGLSGIDVAVSFRSFQTKKLDERELVATIQDGTFCTNDVFSKFDPTKMQQCDICGVKDTLRHRCLDCPRFAEVRSNHPAAVRRWSSRPRSFTEHGLVSKNPFLEQHMAALLHLRDTKEDFQWTPSDGGHFHIFTDGSCLHPKSSTKRLAAWSVVLMDNNIVLASGILPGLVQTVDLAELHAAHSALLWALRARAAICIHSDSSYVVDGLLCLAKLRMVPTAWRHQRQWEDVLHTLLQLDCGQWHIHKVCAHMDIVAVEDPLEEWWIRGNAMADTAATLAYQLCDPAFWSNYTSMCQHFDNGTREVQEQLAFLLGVAQHELQNRGQRQYDPEDLPVSSLAVASEENQFAFCLQISPEDIEALTVQSLGGFSVQFGKAVAQFLVNLDFEAINERFVTGLELLYAFRIFTGLSIPWPRSVSGTVVYEEPHNVCAGGLMRHTFSSALGTFKAAIQSVCFSIGAQFDSSPVSRPDIHLVAPQWSVKIGWPQQVEVAVASSIRTDFTSRPFRRACDLARPLP